MSFPCLPGRHVSKVKNIYLPLILLLVTAAGSQVWGDEKFVVQTVIDQQQGGIPFVALKVPEHWKIAGEVHWKYEDVSAPVSAFVRVWNPDKPESVTFFPRVPCYWLQGASASNRPGSKALGQLNVYPMPPAEALRAAILQFYHPNQPGLMLVGSREMPKLAAILKMDPKIFTGIGIKVTYQENGQAMEEEFYGLCYLNQIPYDGPQGRSIQINWGIERVHSFKAPAGMLDQKRETFARIVYSIETNPQWLARATGIQQYLNDQFNRNLAQGYANIEAAGQLSRQISANNDAMIASMDSQRAAARSSGSSTGGRNANDRFDDYVRGVDTMNDPATGTSQHSITERYHWTDGYGNYAHSNDAGFDPNQTSSISWQQMTPAR